MKNTDIVGDFFSHIEGNLLLHLVNYTLSPTNLIKIYDDDRFKINNTEYHVFSVLLFQKIEARTLDEDIWVNNFFQKIHNLTMNIGRFIGKNDLSLWNTIVKDYDELRKSLDERKINFTDCIDSAEKAMIKTIEKLQKHVDEDRNLEIQSIFLQPFEFYKKIHI